jgi:chorismate mutase/prephenate dehydratase
MFSGSVFINEVTELAVSHNLICHPDAKLEDIKQVISHPQALGQCANYIAEHGFLPVEFTNTALAVKRIAQLNDKSVAAIGSVEAAQIYGLKVLDKDINASKTNTTRFVVLSRSENLHKRDEMGVHTILLFTVRNQAGALAKAIDVIGCHGFNMRTLRSRPMKELLWQYYFYVEAEGNVNTDEGRAMLKDLSKYCDKLKVVGTYTKNS